MLMVGHSQVTASTLYESFLMNVGVKWCRRIDLLSRKVLFTSAFSLAVDAGGDYFLFFVLNLFLNLQVIFRGFREVV